MYLKKLKGEMTMGNAAIDKMNNIVEILFHELVLQKLEKLIQKTTDPILESILKGAFRSAKYCGFCIFYVGKVNKFVYLLKTFRDEAKLIKCNIEIEIEGHKKYFHVLTLFHFFFWTETNKPRNPDEFFSS